MAGRCQTKDSALHAHIANHRPRIVFLGMRCAYSAPPLATLLEASFDVRAVILPGPPIGPPVIRHGATGTNVGRLPIAGAEHGIDDLARNAGAPLLSIRDLQHPETIAALGSFAPDLIAVACFPRRLPRTVLHLPPLGCLNVHPSLLPRGRGPEPVFWTLRRGERRTGATIHLMDQRFDTGPIVRQETFEIPDGARAPELEHRLAQLGGRLLVEAITGLVAGTERPRPQDESRATAAPPPSDADFTITTDRPARWAFNFARGIAPLGGPLRLVLSETGEQFLLLDAVDWSPDATLDAPAIIDSNSITARFQPGTVQFSLRS